MKARLVYVDDSLHLLLCTGAIKIQSYVEAWEFLCNFDNPQYYAGPGVWDYEDLKMEDYSGTTIAIVADDGSLRVEGASLFRNILNQVNDHLTTVQEYAQMHGKQVAIVRRLCQHGRILGATQKGKTWLIPKDSPYPPDERMRK